MNRLDLSNHELNLCDRESGSRQNNHKQRKMVHLFPLDSQQTHDNEYHQHVSNGAQ